MDPRRPEFSFVLPAHNEAQNVAAMAAALSDGHALYAFRYASTETANTLYYRQDGEDVVVVSEPLDNDRSGWQAVPPGHMIVVRDGRAVAPEPIPHDRRLAAE